MRLMINGAVIPFFLTLFSAIISQVLEIKSGKSFCFYDDLKLNNNWGVHFQSSEGAFGIDITTPSAVLFKGEAETYGSYGFQAKEEGRHTICFHNKNAAGTAPRKISFSLLGSSTEKTAEKLDPVQAEIKDLNSGLRSVRDEQDFLRQREEYHDKTAKSTNKRVIVWFVFQFIFLGVVGYVQIYFLKRFFETRRIV